MSFVLLILGTVITAVGIVMIGFGVPINEFSLGNTLIVAGTTACVGGLIVIGLGAAIRQLQRIAESQTSRPALRPARGQEPQDPLSATPARATSASTRPVFPPRPRSSPARELRPSDGGLDRARAAFPAGSRNDFAPPVVDETEAAPLSPLSPLRSSVHPPSSNGEPVPDMRASRSSDTRPMRPAEGGRKPAPESATIPPSERPAERLGPEAFDTVWPADSRPPREDVVHPPRAEPAAQARGNGEPTPRPDPPRTTEPVALAILKSGVVDGMAYTLYTDGSIEAELAQGVVRFASIEELRNHLERSG